jgi:hypothetical protein
MHWIAMALAACLFLSATWAGESALESVESQVLAASRSRAEAFNHRDRAAMQRLTAKDCLITHSGGNVGGRQGVLDNMRMLEPPDEQLTNFSRYHARSIGGVVVLAYVYDDHEHFGDNDVVTQLAATELWTRRSGRWVLAASSVTPIPVNHRPAIAVDRSKLSEYVGRFELRRSQVDEVTIEGDHLVSRVSGEDPEVLYFVAPDVNVSADDLGEARFQRNSDGEVIGYAYRRPDGQEIVAKKLR